MTMSIRKCGAKVKNKLPCVELRLGLGMSKQHIITVQQCYRMLVIRSETE